MLSACISNVIAINAALNLITFIDRLQILIASIIKSRTISSEEGSVTSWLDGDVRFEIGSRNTAVCARKNAI